MTTAQRTFTCNLCDAMCGLHLTVDDNRVTGVRGNPKDVLSRGHLCPKAVALGELHADPDRLRTPMRRTASGFEPISWDDALDEAATRLRAIQRAHGRDAVASYIGNPNAHRHHSAFAAALLSVALGSRNRFDANSQDGNPRLFANFQVYGDGLSMTVPDVDRTDWLLLLGANPAVSHGSTMALGDVRNRLRSIRERGGRVVLIDPRRTESAAFCDEHHFIRPGADAALLLAFLHVLFAERLVDERALAHIATGLDEIRQLAARFSPEQVASAVGIDALTITRLAREFASTKRSVIHARLGPSVGEFGPLACWLVEVLHAVAGKLDQEGGAMFPSPAADVGPIARRIVGNGYDRYRSRVRGLPEFLGALPSAVMAEEMETEGPGRIRALVCLAGNPVLSTPGGDRLARALSGLEYFVAIDYYLSVTSRLAHLVLPPLTVLETGNYELLLSPLAVRNVAKYSPPAVAAPPDARNDFQIVGEIAARMYLPRAIAKSSLLRRAIAAAPDRIIDLLLRLGGSGHSLASLAAHPDGVDLGPLVPSLERHLHTPDRKLHLAPEALLEDVPRLDAWVDSATTQSPSLRLIGRRHLRAMNSWLHNLPSLARGPDRSALLMHPDDAQRLGFSDGQTVRVRRQSASIVARLSVTPSVMPGVISMPHGYGHAEAAQTLRTAASLPGENVNVLTDPLLVEPVIGTSILNGFSVTVEAGTPE